MCGEKNDEGKLETSSGWHGMVLHIQQEFIHRNFPKGGCVLVCGARDRQKMIFLIGRFVFRGNY